MATCCWFSKEEQSALRSLLLDCLRSWRTLLLPKFTGNQGLARQLHLCRWQYGRVLQGWKEKDSIRWKTAFWEKDYRKTYRPVKGEEKACCIIGARHHENNPKLNLLGWICWFTFFFFFLKSEQKRHLYSLPWALQLWARRGWWVLRTSVAGGHKHTNPVQNRCLVPISWEPGGQAPL